MSYPQVSTPIHLELQVGKSLMVKAEKMQQTPTDLSLPVSLRSISGGTMKSH